MPEEKIVREKRAFDELRPVKIQTDYLDYADGSAFIELGKTRVVAAATIEDKAPPFLKGSGTGWVTAEYSMLPRSTEKRNIRERTQGRVSGRVQEIQRLIGRGLRAVTDLSVLGERTIIIDCDVIQADGGTRTAAITGAYVALHDAVKNMIQQQAIVKNPLLEQVAAVSVGIIDGQMYLDLNFEEDSSAQVDMNVVMTKSGKIIEVQGTAEKSPFSIQEMMMLIHLARKGIEHLMKMQSEVLSTQ